MIDKRNQVFPQYKNTLDEVIQVQKKDGIPLEKGVTLTEDFVRRNYNVISDYINYFMAYPDLFLDLIKPQDSNFSLFFYQRIVLRAIMRYKEVYVTACRAFSKSFLSILGIMLQCIFIPGTKRFICAPNKSQAAQIAKEKIMEMYDKFPLIRREVIGGDVSEMPGNFGKDYVTLRFRNGSIFDVVGALDSQRGGRRNGGLIDEIRRKVLILYTFLDENSLYNRGEYNESIYIFYHQ